MHNRERLLSWTFRSVLALLWGAVVPWLAFSFSAVAGFSLVLCLGHIDCGQRKLEGGRTRVSETFIDTNTMVVHFEGHSHCFMHFFCVKTPSGTLLGPAFLESKQGDGARWRKSGLRRSPSSRRGLDRHVQSVSGCFRSSVPCTESLVRPWLFSS